MDIVLYCGEIDHIPAVLPYTDSISDTRFDEVVGRMIEGETKLKSNSERLFNYLRVKRVKGEIEKLTIIFIDSEMVEHQEEVPDNGKMKELWKHDGAFDFLEKTTAIIFKLQRK